MSARTLGLALAVTALSCAYTSIDEHPCPPGGTSATYDNFGADFMARYCQSCHGSAAVDRAGAPGEYIFDTALQVRRHAARIFVRSAAENDSMPPGPVDPTRAERDRLADWLACGAP